MVHVGFREDPFQKLVCRVVRGGVERADENFFVEIFVEIAITFERHSVQMGGPGAGNDSCIAYKNHFSIACLKDRGFPEAPRFHRSSPLCSRLCHSVWDTQVCCLRRDICRLRRCMLKSVQEQRRFRGKRAYVKGALTEDEAFTEN